MSLIQVQLRNLVELPDLIRVLAPKIWEVSFPMKWTEEKKIKTRIIFYLGVGTHFVDEVVNMFEKNGFETLVGHSSLYEVIMQGIPQPQILQTLCSFDVENLGWLQQSLTNCKRTNEGQFVKNGEYKDL